MLNRRQFLKNMLVSGSAAMLLADCAALESPQFDTAEIAAEAIDNAMHGSTEEETFVWLGHQEIAGLSPADTGPRTGGCDPQLPWRASSVLPLCRKRKAL